MISSSEVSKPWHGMSSPQANMHSFSKPKKPFMPRLVRSKTPDHIIGYGSTLQGRFEFGGLLRVEGRFEGVLKPAGGASVAVSRSGVIMGDVEGCHSVMVEGTVIGNISANMVDLRRYAHIEGNVWCKDLSTAPTAVFRNRAAVNTAPSSGASSSSRRRLSSTSNASSSSFDASDGSGSGKATATAASAANVSPSPSAHASELAPAPPTPRGFSGEQAVVATAAATPTTTAAVAATKATTTPSPSGPPSITGTASLTPGSCVTAGGSNAGFSRASAAPSSSAGSIADSGPRSVQGSIAGLMGPAPATRNPDTIAAAVGAAFSVGTATPAVGGGGCPVTQRATTIAAVGSQPVGPRACHRNTGTGNVRGNARLGDAAGRPTGVSNGGGGGGGSAREKSKETAHAPCHRRGGGGGGVGSGGSVLTLVESQLAVGGRDSGSGSLCGMMVVRPSSTPTAREGTGSGSIRGGSGCPLSHNIQAAMGQSQRGVGLDACSPKPKDTWRHCGIKGYGLKSSSLTRAFSSVAMLLQFDGDLMFEEHLQMEYAAENLWFWKRGMKYRAATFHSPEERHEEARGIYEAFLSVDSPDQVNISHEDRENVLGALEGRPEAEAIGAGLFDPALIQVENMLALGPFPRFADSTVKNIDKSWKMVIKCFSLEDAGASFYSVLFEIAPSVERLFKRSKRVQGEMLMSIVDSSVRLLQNLHELVPMLIQVGLRHNGYEVRAEHFPIVGDALVATLSLALGKAFTPAMRQSWIAVYALMSNIMLSVLEPPADEEPMGSMVETSSISSDFGSRESSEVYSTSVGYKTSSTTERSGSAGSTTTGVGGGGSTGSGITASARGIYRRGTSSFRNQFSKFVRKESTITCQAPAPAPSDTLPAQSSSSTSSDFANETLGGATVTTIAAAASSAASSSTPASFARPAARSVDGHARGRRA